MKGRAKKNRRWPVFEVTFRFGIEIRKERMKAMNIKMAATLAEKRTKDENGEVIGSLQRIVEVK